MMVAPLMFYLLAFLGRVAAYLLGGRPGGYGARVALFWAWLAAAPLALFYGLLSGLNGAAAPATQGIGGLWLLILLLFWISGLVEASKGETRS